MITEPGQNSNTNPKNFRRELCPVCNSFDSRCRPSYDDAILCWNSEAVTLADHWFLITDVTAGNTGMRGVMVSPRRGYSESPEDKEAAELKREYAAAQRKKGRANLPSNETRDRGYRSIIDQTSLSSLHKSKLAERGLSESQIKLANELYWFTTWEKGIQLSENIAGYDPATYATRWMGGMLISTLNLKGEIVGGQIAANDPDVIGKYFWLSSARVGGYGCQLQFTGQMPLFVRKHPDCVAEGAEIWLCEGGLKSAITALKLWENNKNIIVIGTAQSARFSDELLEIIAEVKPSKVRILPDAGAIINLDILANIYNCGEKVRRSGLIPVFGWWGQNSKVSSVDIDDYLMQKQGDISEINWLSLAQFSRVLDPQNLTIIAKKNEVETPYLADNSDLPAFLKNPAYASYKAYCEWELPDTSKPGNLITRQPKLATDWRLSEEERSAAIGWENYPPRKGELVFIKGGTGIGKSHLIADWMNGIYREHGCLFIGYRNGLLHQQCAGVEDLQHLRAADSDGFKRMLDPNYRVAFCDASLHNMRASMASEKIIVIDELVSVLHSLLLGTTCSRDRRKRLNIFSEMLKEADTIICLDAHLENWCCKLMQQLANNKTVRRMSNDWQETPRRVKLYTGTQTNPADKTAIRTEILKDAKTMPIAVFSDSQHELKTLHELLLKRGVDGRAIVRVDRETSGEEHIIKLLSNVDQYLEQHPEITVLLVSPSGDSGLDISSNYFQKVFLIFCGVLTINGCLQMYGRVRDRNAPRSIFIAKDARFRRSIGGYTVASVQTQIDLSIENQLKLITAFSPVADTKELIYQTVAHWQQQEKSDLYSDAIGTLTAKGNFERLYYRDLFLDRLNKMGDVVELVNANGNQEVKDEHRIVSEDVKIAVATKILNAEDISEVVAESYSRKDKNPDEENALTKFKLRQSIPGIELTVELVKKLHYNREFITGLEQRYFCYNPAVGHAMAALKWGKALVYSSYFSWDLRSRMAERLDCLQTLGIVEFLNDEIWYERGEQVAILRQRWGTLREKYGANLTGILGIEWDNQKPIYTVSRLLAMVGCELKQEKKKRKSDKTVRRIAYGSLHSNEIVTILESFERRFADIKSVNWEEVETNCKNELSSETIAT